MTLAAGAALEELLPKTLGVGAPVLMSASAYFAVRRKPIPGILFAGAAGAAEDALSSLPYATSLAWFVMMAGLLRAFKLPLFAAAPAFALYQIWLWIWLGGSLSGNVFMRMAVSIPAGVATLAATALILSIIDRKAAVDEK